MVVSCDRASLSCVTIGNLSAAASPMPPGSTVISLCPGSGAALAAFR